jgi:hypothetical protein
MPNAFLPEIWHDLFVMMGSAAAALVGLLFIVMSLYSNAIHGKPDYDLGATIHAARNNTYHLLTVMVTAALILIPQATLPLGAELAAIHLFGLRLPVFFSYTHFIRNRGGFPVSMITTIVAGYGLGAAGGAAFAMHSGWAPYLVSASCIILVVRSVLTAWMLMFERPHHDARGVNKSA